MLRKVVNGIEEPIIIAADIEWPLWAKVLKNRSRTEDKGIGDVAARMIGPENSAAFKTWFKLTFGKDCGCNGRQRHWNQKYPL